MARNFKNRSRQPARRGSRRSPHSKRRPAIIKPAADPRLKKVFASIGVPAKTPFKADAYQLEALAAVRHSDCLVTAPTGAGKTWIALQAIERNLRDGTSAWYGSPLKALSNAKYAEFSEYFGPDKVGILTGDRKENPDAPVIVGTTEILRNQLYDAMERGENLSTDLVILDEAHFLGDEDRGVVWEEIMIYLPPRIPLLMLSATIGNARQIANWLTGIRKRKCQVVQETRRPVPLTPILFHPSGTLLPFFTPKGAQKKQRLYKKVADFIHDRRAPSLSPAGKLPPFGQILRALRKYDLLPAIFFLKSRADCDGALALCLENTSRDPDREAALSSRIQDLVASSSHLRKHRQRWHLEHLAIGAHHSGQLPGWKLMLENLMSAGLLDAIFATSTVAAGVNFPARTVVFLNSDRFNGVDFVPLNPTEFHQMTGRAGRRGMDKIGFAIAIPGRYMDISWVARLTQASPADVVSQIRINFSMVLNLLLSHAPAEIEDLLDRSFANYQIRGDRRNRSIRFDTKFLWRDFLDHLAFLQAEAYVTADGKLTADGRWASQLRVDRPLLIAEGFRNQIFPDEDPVLLAAIISAFVYDKDTSDRVHPDAVPKTLLKAFQAIRKNLRPFVKRMLENRFEVKPLAFKPAVAMYVWASGQPWEDALAASDMEEGTLAMLALRTAENLRQIRNLAPVFPRAAASAASAIDLMLRDPVSKVW